MSIHGISRLWIHVMWWTRDRRPVLDPAVREHLAVFLEQHALENGIPLAIAVVHDDHVHAVVDLPPIVSVAELAKLMKGGSSYWLNGSGLVESPVTWGRGYFAAAMEHRTIQWNSLMPADAVCLQQPVGIELPALVKAQDLRRRTRKPLRRYRFSSARGMTTSNPAP